MRLCPRCGKSLTAESATCPACGHTDSSSLGKLLVVVLAIKAAAICASLRIDDVWINNILAWSGSILAGLLLFLVITGWLEALRLQKAMRLKASERKCDPQRDHITFTVNNLIALVVAFAFLLAGNTIGEAAVVPIALTGGTILMLVLIVCLGIDRAARLAKVRTILGVRQVEPANDAPAVLVARDEFAVVGRSPVTPAPAFVGLNQVKGHQGGPVRFRVFCRGVSTFSNLEVVILLDGEGVGLGSTRHGFDARTETTAGMHELQVRWAALIQTFVVHVPHPGVWEAELSWSWFWNKFDCARRGRGELE